MIVMMKMKRTMAVFALLSLFLLLLAPFPSSADDPCVYSIYVRTGSIFKGGTDSKMSVELYDANGYYITINNLEEWGGLMGPDHDYYERGNLDIFSGLGDCLTGPICALNLTSDGSGAHHGWYCNYLEVTATGAHLPCSQQLFTIEQWLATDASPYSLTALRYNCPDALSSPRFPRMPSNSQPKNGQLMSH